MKRILLLSVFAILPVMSATAQLLGDGSMANPYRGTLTGDFTISGKKYFSGNIIADNEKLTIAAGTTLISVNNKAGILINGTGQLDARGTSTGKILFTADLDLDGINGEATDTWGNITLISTGINLMDYCTIENGRKTDPRIGSYGGGLYLGTSTASVTNTVIRNCLAIYGGGIIVAGTSSPVISRCILMGNTANEQGGAIYVAGGSSPLISNVIFRNNSSLSSTLKGGSVASIASSPIIVNSTIVYSSSPAVDGKSVYLENSSGARVISTIMWGGSDHVGLSGTPSTVVDYCAIEGTSIAGCIDLNSSNTAPDGPNFVNPGSGDFSITFDSPCRDMGSNGYPGVTIPPRDFINTVRVGLPDIGAYEVIYSRWLGISDDWTRIIAWDKGFVPGTRNIVIPAGLSKYPTLSPGPSFTLNTGLKMIVEPGAKVTFSSLTNNGTIYLKADANAMASLMTNNFSGSGGSLNAEVFLKGSTGEEYLWHYIASPATVPKTVFTDFEPYNLMLYDESKVVTVVDEGWQWHDGYDGTTPFSNLEARKGYNVLVYEDTTFVFKDFTAMTTTMGQINLPFSGSGGDTSLYGYSLIGNSLTCGINWDLVTFSDPVHVRDAIYFNQGGVDVSYVDGVGTNGGSAHIPPLQGFFVKTRATGTYITIPNTAREHNSTVRYKSSQVIPLLRLALETGKSSDETVIRFESLSTDGFDSEYDAGKMFSPSDNRAHFYSVLNGDIYSINSIPWPKTKTVIPLTVIIPEAGNYTIRRSQLQGTDNLKLTLYDALTGTRTDLLNSTGYAFTASVGTLANRFSVTIYPGSRELTEKQDLSGSLKIYSSAGKVCVLPEGPEWTGVKGRTRIFDVTGRLIMSANEEWFNAGDLKEYFPPVTGILIVEVTAGTKRYLEKIILTP
jgi:hypothetical protein